MLLCLREIAPSGSWVEKNESTLDCSNSKEPCFTKCFTPVSGPCSVDVGIGLEIYCGEYHPYYTSNYSEMIVRMVFLDFPEFDMNVVDVLPAGNSTSCQLTTPTNHLDVKMALVMDECSDPPCNSYQGVPKVSGGLVPMW